MEKFKSERGKEVWLGVKYDSPFHFDMFHKVDMSNDPFNDVQFALHTNLGSLTVLDRETGYEGGVRDIETGFREIDGGRFWLASGGFDVRFDSGAKTIGEAIEWVKNNSNTCKGVK